MPSCVLCAWSSFVEESTVIACYRCFWLKSMPDTSLVSSTPVLIPGASSLLFLFFHQCDRIQTLKRNSADRVPIQIHLSIPLGRYFINSVRRLFHDARVLCMNNPFRSRSLDVHQFTLRASRNRRNNRSTVCFDALKTTTLITRGRYRR